MSFAEFCVRRPAFTTMLVMSLIVTGVFSFRDLGVDLLPRADPATVTVTLRLPGASPEELTTSVAEPAEQALSSIAGIDEMQTRISEGNVRIMVKFVLERDLDEAAQDVREKIAGAVRNLPPQVEPPVVTKVDPDAEPVFSIAVSGPSSLRTLTEIADKQIRRTLETVDGVGEVTVAGGRAREIHIELDIEKLNAHGLTVDEVREAVESENVEIPGGRIQQGEAELTLRTLGRLESIAQFENVVVDTADGTPVRLSDVAVVQDTAEEARTAAFLDGERTVALDIRRQSGQNTVVVIEALKERLASLRAILPPGLSVTVMRDDSRFIYASVASLEEHLIFGSLFAALIVLVFIRNMRVVLIAALAIPASIIATFTLMRVAGFTLNGMTLLALTLAVGIVIDDAIVVLENIFRHLEEEHRSPFQAAIEGTRQVTLAVAATSLSLVIIFMPVGFMTGFTRRFLYEFGLTMSFAVMVSLLVSLTLTPMLSARVLRARANPHARASGFFGSIERSYTRMLEWSLAHRGMVVALSLLAFAATFPLSVMIGRSFLPSEDQSEFEITVDAPEGTSLEGMEKTLLEMTPKLASLPGVAHVMPTVFERVNHSHILVKLDLPEDRDLTQEQVAALAREALADYPAYRPTVLFKTPVQSGEAAGWPVLVNLYGPDLYQLADYAVRLNDRLQSLPQFIDVKARVNLGSPEVRVAVDRQRAADLGVRNADLAGALRLMVSGEDEISSYREGVERYPVKIRVREDQREDINAIGALTVPSRRGAPVRIDNLARLERGLGPTSIQRLDRQFSVGVSSDLRPGVALDNALRVVNDEIRRLDLPAEYSTRLGGQGRLLDETAQNMLVAILLASIFIYMVLAAQFESFVHPLVIMTALPLSVPFALLTLALTGRALNLWSTLGVLLLLGIVKKNSILQVDYTNVLRRQGVPLQEALLTACRTRLRPILMTTAAIVAGLVPTALGVGAGAQQRSDIAVTIIGGQTLCLLLTLLLVPVAYSLVEDARARVHALRPTARFARLRGALVRRPAGLEE